LQRAVGDLNRLYAQEPALYRTDSEPSGFSWVIGDDAQDSVYAYERRADGAEPLLVVLNMTPIPRRGFRIGVAHSGRWRERINTDAAMYGGSNVGNGGAVATQAVSSHGHPQSLELVLPPLAALILQREA
jgi:1,4-alpha-glucan branching enzyme